MHCAICLNLDGERIAATTMAAGYAVCDTHVVLLEHRDVDFLAIMQSARAQQQRERTL